MRAISFLFVVSFGCCALGYHIPAPLDKHGNVVDTKEVAAVKHDHYATLSKAGGAIPHYSINTHGHIHHEAPYHAAHEHNVYHGPPAPLNHDGTVAETPEVKHVKHERLGALAEAFAKAHNGNYFTNEHNIWKRSIYGSEHSGHYHGPPAPLNHDGTVAETPEVAHIKHERLAALAEAFAKAPQDHYHHEDGYGGHHTSSNYITQAHHEDVHRYHGPPAPLNHDGTVAETPEVKHLKAEHLAAVADAFAKAPHSHSSPGHNIWKRSIHQSYGYYKGPSAPLNHDGTVAETPEVAHVKHERLAALAEAYAHAPQDHYHEETFSDYHPVSLHYDSYTPHDESHKYHGPPAPLNHDGTVAETPDVKHLKAEHLAAVAKAFARAPIGHSSHDHSLWKRSAYQSYGYYKGPAVPLNHDGTVAETPEVKAAKAIHLAAHAKFSYPSFPASHPQIYENDDHSSYLESKYHGPPAPLNHDGTVAETPEVKHLKIEHLAAVAEAFAKAPHGYDEYENSYEHPKISFPSHTKYIVPAPLNHDGTVAETPEVLSRKAEHFAAHHKALYQGR